MENILKRKISVHQTVKESCERYRLHILFRNCKTFFLSLIKFFLSSAFQPVSSEIKTHCEYIWNGHTSQIINKFNVQGNRKII